jgi:hypothetical protein
MDTRKAKIENKSTLTDSDYGTAESWNNVQDPAAIYSIYKKAPCNDVLVTGGISKYYQSSSLAPVDYNKLSLALNYGDATEYAPLAAYGGVMPAAPGGTPAPAPAPAAGGATPVVTPTTSTSMMAPRLRAVAAGGNGGSYYSPNQQTFSVWRTPY